MFPNDMAVKISSIILKENIFLCMLHKHRADIMVTMLPFEYHIFF